MVAQNVGAGLWDRVSRITRVGVLFNFLMTGVLVAVLLLLDRLVLGLFLPDDAHALAIARHIDLTVSWSFILFGVTIRAVCHGAGDRCSGATADYSHHLDVAHPAAVCLIHEQALRRGGNLVELSSGLGGVAGAGAVVLQVWAAGAGRAWRANQSPHRRAPKQQAKHRVTMSG